MDHPFPRAFPQEGNLRFLVGCRVDGKLVTEILEIELEARRQLFGIFDGLGQVGKERGHLCR